MTGGRMVFALLLIVIACGPAALSREDVTSLHDAEVMFLLGYKSKDAGTPGAQFDRAAYCAVDSVLRRHDAGQLEEGITCQRKFR